MVDDHCLELRHKHGDVLNRSFMPSEAYDADRVQASAMKEHVSARNNDPQLDEEVWQAWLRKNDAKDKIRLARRKKLLAIILMLGITAIVLWRIAR